MPPVLLAADEVLADDCEEDWLADALLAEPPEEEAAAEALEDDADEDAEEDEEEEDAVPMTDDAAAEDAVAEDMLLAADDVVDALDDADDDRLVADEALTASTMHTPPEHTSPPVQSEPFWQAVRHMPSGAHREVVPQSWSCVHRNGPGSRASGQAHKSKTRPATTVSFMTDSCAACIGLAPGYQPARHLWRPSLRANARPRTAPAPYL